MGYAGHRAAIPYSHDLSDSIFCCLAHFLQFAPDGRMEPVTRGVQRRAPHAVVLARNGFVWGVGLERAELEAISLVVSLKWAFART